MVLKHYPQCTGFKWCTRLRLEQGFIVASRKCSTKAVTKVFKLIFKQTQSFHEKSHFYSDVKKFWVVGNSKHVIDRLDQINAK